MFNNPLPQCTNTIAAPVLGFGYKTFWLPPCTSCIGSLYGHIVARITYLASAVICTICAILDIALGALAVLVALLTLGMVQKFNTFAAIQFAGGFYILALFPIGSIVMAINPKAIEWDPDLINTTNN